MSNLKLLGMLFTAAVNLLIINYFVGLGTIYNHDSINQLNHRIKDYSDYLIGLLEDDGDLDDLVYDPFLDSTEITFRDLFFEESVVQRIEKKIIR